MKKIVAMLCLMPGLTMAAPFNDLYLGARVGVRQMGFKTGYGENMFAKNLQQYSIFAGTNLNRTFGLELSGFTTNNKKRDVLIADGETALGFADFSGLGTDGYRTKTSMQGLDLRVRAKHCFNKQFSVFANAGVGLARLKLKADMTLNGGAAPSAAEAAGNRIDQKKTKLYPVVAAGLDYKFTRNFGARADIGWENTAAFKWGFQTTPPGVTRDLLVKAKNSVVYGLSVYYAM